jgi:hypothetical protein
VAALSEAALLIGRAEDRKAEFDEIARPSTRCSMDWRSPASSSGGLDLGLVDVWTECVRMVLLDKVQSIFCQSTSPSPPRR